MVNKYLKNYSTPYIENQEILFLKKVLESKQLTQGSFNRKFEKALSKEINNSNVTTVNNGSNGLLLVFLYIKLLIKKKKITNPTILIPNITFIASANVARLLGFDISIVDTEKDSSQTNEIYLQKAISNCKKNNKTPVCFVNTFITGQVNNLKKIFDTCKINKIYCIEDGCHAFGSRYHSGPKTYKVGECKHSDFCVFSFHAIKNLTTAEGGCIFSRRSIDIKKIGFLKNNSIKNISNSKNQMKEYDVTSHSSNFRLSDINSAIGLAQLKYLKKKYKNIFGLNKTYLKYIKFNDIIKPIKIYSDQQPYWHLFSILINFKKLKINRANFQKELLKFGIGSQVHYKPVSKMSIFFEKKDQLNFSNSLEYYSRCLSLPLHNYLNINDIIYVCKKINLLVFRYSKM